MDLQFDTTVPQVFFNKSPLSSLSIPFFHFHLREFNTTFSRYIYPPRILSLSLPIKYTRTETNVMPKWGNNKMLDVCRYAVQRIRNSRPLNSLCNQTRLALLHGEKRTSNRRMLDIRPSFPITLPQRSRNERSSSGRTRGEKKREREREVEGK